MSRISGKNTKPEIMVRKYLHSKGYRFRLHDSKLPGKPDIVLKKHASVIEVRGCFWHGHDKCMLATLPKTRVDYWKSKINRNIERDKKNKNQLENQGWQVIVVWECQLKNHFEEEMKKVERLLKRM